MRSDVQREYNMKLTLDEKFVILTWMPTAITYLIGDTKDALIMLGGNVAGMMLYLYRDEIRSNHKLMGFLRKIF